MRPAGEDAELAKDQAARAARLPSLAWRALRARAGERPGAGAGAPAGLPARAGLPALPGPRPLRPACRARSAPDAVMAGATIPLGGRGAGTGPARPAWSHVRVGPRTVGEGRTAVPRPARAPRRARRPLLPLVRPGRARLAVPGLRQPPGCGPWSSAPAVPPRSWAGPSPPSRCAPRAGTGCSPPSRRPRAGRRHARGRAGGRGRLRGGGAARRLGAARPGRPAGGEETLRRWMNAAALLRPGGRAGGARRRRGCPPYRRCCAGIPITHAERELAERAELGFPPAVRMATLTGSAAAVRQMLGEVRAARPRRRFSGRCRWTTPGRRRAMVRVAARVGAALAAALKGASRSACGT